MTPVEKMKSLLEKHSTGWRFQDQTEDGSASSEVQFLNALMQLAPHLVALWDEIDENWPGVDSDAIDMALNNLSKKASEVLK